jgi:murein peptide amidase A
VVAAVAAGCCLPATAGAGGFSYLQMPARGGIAPPGSPYRWTTIPVRGDAGRATVVARVERRGGRIDRWWSLRGAWHLTAPAYDGAGAGLATRAGVLVLARFGPAPRGLRRRTQLAILDTGPHRRGESAVRHLTLPGDYGVDAISPDGATLYLVHTISFFPGSLRFTIQPYDLRTRRLLPAAAIAGGAHGFAGVAVTRLQDVSGHRVYTLYADGAGPTLRMYLLALDTYGRTLTRVGLPRLRGYRDPYMLRLRLDAAGQRLAIGSVARIDLRRLPPPPSPAPIGIFSRVVGHSAGGRPIELLEVGDLSLPGRMLVFGCIHGDECGASALRPLRNGCPDPYLHAYLVPNLDPDGSAAETRLNAHGVDLNRNFAAEWRPRGARGSLEYAGPRPFSEPETRLAARLIRRIQPQLTIWFHQDWGEHAYVRAWGQSVPAARRFAKLAGIGFRLLRWPAGTAPNWQNHRFPLSASFVVETPRGKLSPPLQTRLTAALSRLGEQVEEDPDVARMG